MAALDLDHPVALDFAGKDKLVSALDAAVAHGDAHAIIRALRASLEKLLREKAFTLPASAFEPVAGHYARRELYASPEHGYTVIAMTWGPGQGTPLHDHAGQWCVEGVVQGRIEVIGYRLLERDGESFRFAETGRSLEGAGSTGGLVAPDEHHIIRNPSDTGIAVTLHVYQAEMNRCHVFVPDPRGAGWHRRSEKLLAVD